MTERRRLQSIVTENPATELFLFFCFSVFFATSNVDSLLALAPGALFERGVTLRQSICALFAPSLNYKEDHFALHV